jgi:hypothetical protein
MSSQAEGLLAGWAVRFAQRALTGPDETLAEMASEFVSLARLGALGNVARLEIDARLGGAVREFVEPTGTPAAIERWLAAGALAALVAELPPPPDIPQERALVPVAPAPDHIGDFLRTMLNYHEGHRWGQHDDPIVGALLLYSHDSGAIRAAQPLRQDLGMLALLYLRGRLGVEALLEGSHTHRISPSGQRTEIGGDDADDGTDAGV